MKKIAIVLLLVVWSLTGLANPIAQNFFSELLFNSEGWILEVYNLDYVYERPDSLIIRPIILQSGTDTVTTTNFTISADSLFFIVNSSDIGSVFTLNPEGDDLQVGFILEEEWIWTEQFTYGPNGDVAAPRPGQSICFGRYHHIDVSFTTYYLNNSPTIGFGNGSEGAHGQGSGLVLDPYGVPVTNVSIHTPFYESETSWPFFEVLTDSAGQFVFNTISFRWTLNIEKDGYQSQTLEVQIWPDSTIELNIVLQPDPEYYQSYFPLQVGNIWIYQGVCSDTVTVSINSIATFNDLQYYKYIRKVGSSSAEKYVRYDSLGNIIWYSNGKDNVLYYLSLGISDSVIIPLPEDTLYIYSSKINSVITQAGNFSDIIVLSSDYAISIDTDIWGYFARNIGLVKLITDSPCGHEESLIYAKVNGVEYPTSSIKPNSNQLDKYALELKNYPNPFNSSTTLKYHLPETGDVRLSIFDLSGRLVEELFSGRQSAGDYHYLWSGRYLPSGIYFISLQVGDLKVIQKCMLMK